MMNKQQTESVYTQAIAEIVWKYVNNDVFPHLSEDELLKLQTHFYYQTQKNILSSILKHADKELLDIYQLSTDEEIEPSAGFNYVKFDVLFEMAVKDDELTQKVADDIDEFANRFTEKAKRYLDFEA